MLELFKVGKDDISMLSEMLSRCFADSYLPDGLNPATESTTAIFHSNNSKNMSAYIAIENNEAVGVIRLSASDSTVRILDLAVEPEYRSRGIGSRMLTKLLSIYDSCNQWYVQVVAQDDRAMNFYILNGFAETDAITEIDEDLYFVELVLVR